MLRKFIGFLFSALIVVLAFLTSPPVVAQQASWIQVEAHPSLAEAEGRARAYGTAFGDVNGFRMRSGWYAVALGPYGPAEARERLQELRIAGVIPIDSYLADGQAYGTQFWPAGAAVSNAAPAPTEGLIQVLPIPQTQQQPSVAPVTQTTQQALPQEPREETRAQARANESALSADERKAIQIALQWFGFYKSGIDGAFGPGSRRAMAVWQEENLYPATGVLTTRQRTTLLDNYQRALAALGLEEVREETAGIEITMPGALVEFEKYNYPFVHYAPKDDSGVRILLISQPGDTARLTALYNVMKTLQIVPPTGSRSLKSREFTLTGQDDTLHSYSYARQQTGMIKGFTLAYPPEKAGEMKKVIEVMQRTLTSRDAALSEEMSQTDAQSLDLLSGLELRKPTSVRSGFFVNSSGAVLTSAESLDSCARITFGDDQEAEIGARNGHLAVLKPKTSLAPLGYARFASGVGRLRSDVTVAGYSYGGKLPAPTMTFGTLADIRGLQGEEDLQRLEIATLGGDVGGPVLDMSGAVTGLVLPDRQASRTLPDGVALSARPEPVLDFLKSNGVAVSLAEERAEVGPEEVASRASDMTVLVNCW
ncbi:MAG: peptidoglycan-binding protein [Litoreibacter sp.]|nr:peptidoglycan-binding protein [Litoreibacter sp.]